MERIERARTDNAVEGIFVRGSTDGMPPAQAEEIRAELQAFRESGKFVVAHLQSDGVRMSMPGYMAVADCRDIGKVYRIVWRGMTARLMAFDCAGDRATLAWMHRGNVVGEIDANVARAWGVVGRVIKGAMVCEE